MTRSSNAKKFALLGQGYEEGSGLVKMVESSKIQVASIIYSSVSSPPASCSRAWRIRLAPPIVPSNPLGCSLVDVARTAGLNRVCVFGSEQTKRWIIETTGCGIAFFDYDQDGWQDIFQVNGSHLPSFPPEKEPTNHLYRNNRDGTFTDVTAKAGLIRSGWGQGVYIGDYDIDGLDDLFVTYWGQNILHHNNGDGTFTDVTEKAGLTQRGTLLRWNTGCCFVDYDKDGNLDLSKTPADSTAAPRPMGQRHTRQQQKNIHHTVKTLR